MKDSSNMSIVCTWKSSLLLFVVCCLLLLFVVCCLLLLFLYDNKCKLSSFVDSNLSHCAIVWYYLGFLMAIIVAT